MWWACCECLTDLSLDGNKNQKNYKSSIPKSDMSNLPHLLNVKKPKPLQNLKCFLFCNLHTRLRRKTQYTWTYERRIIRSSLSQGWSWDRVSFSSIAGLFVHSHLHPSPRKMKRITIQVKPNSECQTDFVNMCKHRLVSTARNEPLGLTTKT